MNDHYEREPPRASPWREPAACNCGGCNICGFYGRAKRPQPPLKAERPAPAKPKTPNLFEETK